MLTASSLIIAAGLALLGLAQGIVGLTMAWLVLGTSTTLTKLQIDRRWSVVVQYSVPVLGVVGWLMARELARPRGQPVDSGGHPVATEGESVSPRLAGGLRDPAAS